MCPLESTDVNKYATSVNLAVFVKKPLLNVAVPVCFCFCYGCFPLTQGRGAAVTMSCTQPEIHLSGLLEQFADPLPCWLAHMLACSEKVPLILILRWKRQAAKLPSVPLFPSVHWTWSQHCHQLVIHLSFLRLLDHGYRLIESICSFLPSFLLKILNRRWVTQRPLYSLVCRTRFMKLEIMTISCKKVAIH